MLSENWKKLLGPEGLLLLAAAMERADKEYAEFTVYPPKEEIFSAFHLVEPEDVRAVILGQDPYHEAGQAHGLAFSVRKGVALPPSLRNIFTELMSDIGCEKPQSGDLTPWAKQGVLLLNATLTVRSSAAASHQKLGWQEFTDFVVKKLSELEQPIAFVLWGSHAQKKCTNVASKNPRVALLSPHPSPLSAYRGFFGSKPFSKINAFLAENGEKTIDWRL